LKMNLDPVVPRAGPVVTTVALATSGFTTPEVRGQPAVFMFAKYDAVVRRLFAAVCGVGFRAYIDWTSVVLVQPDPVYFDVSVAASRAVQVREEDRQRARAGAPV